MLVVGVSLPFVTERTAFVVSLSTMFAVYVTPVMVTAALFGLLIVA